MAQAFFGGVHPNDMKAATNEKAIEQLAAPAEVVIPMSMHIGAPCKPIVAVGDKVTIGQKIGEPGGFVSAPIHASVSGTVKAVEPRPFSMGGTMMSVVIENDFQNTVCPDIHPVDDPDSLTPEQLVEIVKNAGIVGQGGATFPTHVKISSGLGKVDYVIINAAECEPYITGDHRTMLERPEQVIKGATLLAKCFGVEHVYIGVEANKQNAADVLNKTIDELKAPVVVEVLHTRYPQGAEKQLCQAISGRQVPSGKLPADAGCCIFNLNTTCAIYKAVYTGMPVVSKVVTVSGSGVIEPKNLECPIGTPITALFDACGGLKEETYKLIMGGPMMGLAQYNLDVTVGKGTGAMLAFAGDEEQYEENPQCIRCGKCVGVCPMRLEPVFMYKYLMKGDVDTWQNTLHGMDCIECGACAYTCPARLPLTHAFRMGKRLQEFEADRVLLPPHPVQREHPDHHDGRDHCHDPRSDHERVRLWLPGPGPDPGVRGRLRVLGVGLSQAPEEAPVHRRPVRRGYRYAAGLCVPPHAALLDDHHRRVLRHRGGQAAVRRHRLQLHEPRSGGPCRSAGQLCHRHDHLGRAHEQAVHFRLQR